MICVPPSVCRRRMWNSANIFKLVLLQLSIYVPVACTAKLLLLAHPLNRLKKPAMTRHTISKLTVTISLQIFKCNRATNRLVRSPKSPYLWLVPIFFSVPKNKQPLQIHREAKVQLLFTFRGSIVLHHFVYISISCDQPYNKKIKKLSP